MPPSVPGIDLRATRAPNELGAAVDDPGYRSNPLVITMILILTLICWSITATCSISVCRAAAQGEDRGAPPGGEVGLK